MEQIDRYCLWRLENLAVQKHEKKEGNLIDFRAEKIKNSCRHLHDQIHKLATFEANQLAFNAVKKPLHLYLVRSPIDV
jgi:hypothetical protein